MEKVYDHQPHDQMSFLDTMNPGCLDISAGDCKGWIGHARRTFPRGGGCDVVENLWPNAGDSFDWHCCVAVAM